MKTWLTAIALSISAWAASPVSVQAQNHPQVEPVAAANEALARGNPTEAAQIIRTAAESGNGAAQLLLSEFYAHGIGVDQDYTEQRLWLRRALANDLWIAAYLLGSLYENGISAPKDMGLAIELYTLAGARGVAEASFRLARIYEDEWDSYGSLSDSDYFRVQRSGLVDRAREDYEEWLLKAAEQGHSEAQRLYGDLRFFDRDYAEALRWLTLAADQGNARAMFKISAIYEAGWGVTPDAAEAERWMARGDAARRAESQ